MGDKGKDRAVAQFEVEPLSRGPGPAGAVNLFASLATAGLVQNVFPLNVGLVVCVNGGGNVEGALQGLASAGVDHGPLYMG